MKKALGYGILGAVGFIIGTVLVYAPSETENIRLVLLSTVGLPFGVWLIVE